MDQIGNVLCVGIEYGGLLAWPTQNASVATAANVAQSFKNRGGVLVETCLNPVRAELLFRFDQLLRDAQNNGAGSLLYFAGHGTVEGNGIEHLWPSDYNDSFGRHALVSLQHLVDCVPEQTPPTLIVLDCCRIETTAPKKPRFSPPHNTSIWYSCKRGKPAHVHKTFYFGEAFSSSIGTCPLVAEDSQTVVNLKEVYDQTGLLLLNSLPPGLSQQHECVGNIESLCFATNVLGSEYKMWTPEVELAWQVADHRLVSPIVLRLWGKLSGDPTSAPKYIGATGTISIRLPSYVGTTFVLANYFAELRQYMIRLSVCIDGNLGIETVHPLLSSYGWIENIASETKTYSLQKDNCMFYCAMNNSDTHLISIDLTHNTGIGVSSIAPIWPGLQKLIEGVIQHAMGR